MEATKTGNWYHYFSNGLHITSELPFPELAEASGEPDVVIRFGAIPQNTGSEQYKFFGESSYEVAGDDFLLDIKDAARYLVRGGEEVIIEAYPGAQQDAIRLYILATVFGVLLHKHHILPLHASSINTGKGTVLISGVSGAGKSTLALGLYHKGYEVLNDDISSVFFKGDKPYVHTGYVHLKLWAASLEQYGYESQDFRKLENKLDKYSFPISRPGTIEPLPLRAVFFITSSEEIDQPEQELLHGLTAFSYLRANTFRYTLIKPLQKSDSHFHLCSDLVNAIPIIKVTRPKNILPEEFANYIENLFNVI
jgi:hypothetical protein